MRRTPRRVRRLAFTEQADREQAQQLAGLIRKTDALAAEWESFAASAKRRDEQYFSTGPRNGFEMEKYSSEAFAPFVAVDGPSQWERFKALVTESLGRPRD